MVNHELNSVLIYIHPTLAILGYIFIFIFAALTFRQKGRSKIFYRYGVSAWLLTLLGLLTGMIWAQIAWGSYWSWDPKETMTLILFLSVSASIVARNEGKVRLTKCFAVSSCGLALFTVLSSFISIGLHSFV